MTNARKTLAIYVAYICSVFISRYQSEAVHIKMRCFEPVEITSPQPLLNPSRFLCVCGFVVSVVVANLSRVASV